MNVNADKRKLMHVESMATPMHTRSSPNLPPTHMSVALLRFPTVMSLLLLTEGGIYEVFLLETGLGSDVKNSTFSPSLS